MACQHFPDDQTLRLQTGAGEDDIIHLPSGLDHADSERQEEEGRRNNMGRAEEDQPESSSLEGCCCGPLFRKESRGISQVSQV